MCVAVQFCTNDSPMEEDYSQIAIIGCTLGLLMMLLMI